MVEVESEVIFNQINFMPQVDGCNNLFGKFFYLLDFFLDKADVLMTHAWFLVISSKLDLTAVNYF